jgi:hypothetical protein
MSIYGDYVTVESPIQAEVTRLLAPESEVSTVNPLERTFRPQPAAIPTELLRLSQWSTVRSSATVPYTAILQADRRN